MSKTLGKCKVCDSTRLLNYASLCKRCTKRPESMAIKEKLLEARKENIAANQEAHKHDEENLREREKLEKKEDLTSDEKEKLIKLIPEINSLDELTAYLEKKNKPEETKEE